MILDEPWLAERHHVMDQHDGGRLKRAFHRHMRQHPHVTAALLRCPKHTGIAGGLLSQHMPHRLLRGGQSRQHAVGFGRVTQPSGFLHPCMPPAERTVSPAEHLSPPPRQQRQRIQPNCPNSALPCSHGRGHLWLIPPVDCQHNPVDTRRVGQVFRQTVGENADSIVQREGFSVGTPNTYLHGCPLL